MGVWRVVQNGGTLVNCGVVQWNWGCWGGGVGSRFNTGCLHGQFHIIIVALVLVAEGKLQGVGGSRATHVAYSYAMLLCMSMARVTPCAVVPLNQPLVPART